MPRGTLLWKGQEPDFNPANSSEKLFELAGFRVIGVD